jgi:hypothetical protein
MFKKYLRKISDNVYHGHITDFAILDIVKNSTFNLELYLDGNHFHLGRHNAFNLVKKFMRDKQKAEVYLIEGPVMKISDLLEMPQISKSSLDHYYDEKINSKNFELTKNMILLGSKDGYDHYHNSNSYLITYGSRIVFLSIFTFDTSSSSTLGKAVVQQNLWRDRKNKFHVSAYTKEASIEIITDYFFDTLHCDTIMSDTNQTESGKHYWKKIITVFPELSSGYRFDGKIHTIEDNLDDLWGDTDKFADIQLFITKKEI